MTIAGANALEVELIKLKDEERPRIVNEIATARAVSYTHLTLPTILLV